MFYSINYGDKKKPDANINRRHRRESKYLKGDKMDDVKNKSRGDSVYGFNESYGFDELCENETNSILLNENKIENKINNGLGNGFGNKFDDKINTGFSNKLDNKINNKINDENKYDECMNNDNKNPSIYKVFRPKFSKRERSILEELRENIVDLAISQNMSSFNEKLILSDINRFLENKFHDFDEDYRNKLANTMLQELLGYGEIDNLLKDDDLEEIMVIGVGKPVFVYHRKFGMMETDLIFESEDKIMYIIDSIAREANRRIDQQSPILDAHMNDGSRINATISPLSADGPTLTIRKFKKDSLTIVDLIKYGTLNTDIAAFLWLTVDGLGVKPANIIIAGGTSSGKTTLLNALSVFINPKERIITIEDTLELQFHHKHIVRMEARSVNIENQGEITIEDLVKNSLRQRPDRIIVGEVRGSEAITLFTALNTGHSGFGTLHANNSRETISRLTNAPMSVPKIMISSIDYIIMEKRIYKSNGISYRRVTEIDEVVGMEEGTISLNKLFRWDGENDSFENLTILSNTIEKIANLKGVSINELNEDLENRKKILDFFVKNDVSSIGDISSFMEEYYYDSDSLLNKLGI